MINCLFDTLNILLVFDLFISFLSVEILLHTDFLLKNVSSQMNPPDMRW